MPARYAPWAEAFMAGRAAPDSPLLGASLTPTCCPPAVVAKPPLVTGGAVPAVGAFAPPVPAASPPQATLKLMTTPRPPS
jgi:hypothetical protein